MYFCVACSKVELLSVFYLAVILPFILFVLMDHTAEVEKNSSPVNLMLGLS